MDMILVQLSSTTLKTMSRVKATEKITNPIKIYFCICTSDFFLNSSVNTAKSQNLKGHYGLFLLDMPLTLPEA